MSKSVYHGSNVVFLGVLSTPIVTGVTSITTREPSPVTKVASPREVWLSSLSSTFIASVEIAVQIQKNWKFSQPRKELVMRAQHSLAELSFTDQQRAANVVMC